MAVSTDALGTVPGPPRSDGRESICNFQLDIIKDPCILLSDYSHLSECHLQYV